MSDLRELLADQAALHFPTEVPDFAGVTRRRRKRLLRQLATALWVTAVLGSGAIIVATSTEDRPADTLATGPADAAAEPRPFKRYEEPYPEPVIEAEFIKDNRTTYAFSKPWTLLGVNKSGTALVVQPQPNEDCTPLRLVAVEYTNTGVTVVVFATGRVGPGTRCAQMTPLRIPLSEPLGDRSLRHAPAAFASTFPNDDPPFQGPANVAYRWDDTDYAEVPPTGTHARMTGQQVLGLYEAAEPREAAEHRRAGRTPTVYFWLWSNTAAGIFRQPVWVIRFTGVAVGANDGTDYTGCTQTLMYHDATGGGIRNRYGCGPEKVTPPAS